MKKSQLQTAFSGLFGQTAFWKSLLVGSACISMVSCAGLSSTNSGGLAGLDENRPQYADYLSARYAGLMRDGGSASTYYSQALKRAPDDESLLERAIIYALVAGDTKQALKLAKENASSTQDNGSMVEILLAVDKFSREKYKSTVNFQGELSTGLMRNVVARSLRNWSQLGLQEEGVLLPIAYTGKESRLFRGVRLYSDGLLQLANGQDQQALESLEKAWKLGGRYPVGVDALVRLHAEKGDLDAAKNIVDQFYEEIGDNPLIDQVDKDLRAGIDISAPRLSPNEGAASSILGFALAIAAGQSGDIANLYYSIVLLLDPDQDAARLLLADSMRSADRLDAAIEQLQYIDDRSVYYGAARAREAWVLYDQDKHDSAINLAQTALETKPGRSLKMQIGDLYRSLEMYEQAEQLFDDVFNKDAEEGFVDWRVLFARAGMRDKLLRWEEAEADLIAALGYAPDRPEVLNYLGYSWVDRGVNIDRAFQMIQSAMEQRPDQGYIRDSLGWAYYRLSHYEKAVKFLEEAAALDPSDPVINDHLGDAYWRIGRHTQAEYQWSRVAQYSEDPFLKASAKQKLQHGLDAQLTELQVSK